MSESELVNSFNDYFRKSNYRGISVRKKQSRFQSQHFDILVCSADLPDLVIEHKSFKTSSSGKLYFSQHFKDGTNGDELGSGHQIERIMEFCDRAGKAGWLAIEVRRGVGTPKELYFVKWEKVYEMYYDWKNGEGQAGFSREWLQENATQIERNTDWEGGYEIKHSLFYEFNA